jgi:Flp pilus assembly protein TadD
LINVGEVLQLQADQQGDAQAYEAGKRAALEVVERAIELGKKEGEVPAGWHGTRGSLLLQLGRFEEAVPEIEQLIAGRPDDIEGLIDLGAARTAIGKPREALDPLRHALGLAPDHIRGWMAAGDANRLAGDKPHARDCYQRVVDLVRAARGPQAEGDPFLRAAAQAIAQLGS